jgi:hypothetical protein
MSIVKTLPNHKSILDVINSSKSERKFNAQVPKPCTEIKFDDFTQSVVTNTLRVDSVNSCHIRDKCCVVQNRKHKAIKDKLPEFAKNMLKYPGVCIAGGSIVNHIKDINYANDYDVFFYNVTADQILKMLNECFAKLASYERVADFVMYRNMISFEVNHKKYQCILVEYRTPQEIIQYFDLGVSQVCITNTDIYITDYARFCMLNNAIVYDTDQCISNSYNHRICKYNYFNQKRFSIIFPHLTPDIGKEVIKIEDLQIKKDRVECDYQKLNTVDAYNGNTDSVLIGKYIKKVTEHIPYLTVKGLDMKKVKPYRNKHNDDKSGNVQYILNKANTILGMDLQISQAKIKECVKTAKDKATKPLEKCKDGVITIFKTNTESDLLNAFTMHHSKTAKELFGKCPNYCETPYDFVI